MRFFLTLYKASGHRALISLAIGVVLSAAPMLAFADNTITTGGGNTITTGGNNSVFTGGSNTITTGGGGSAPTTCGDGQCSVTNPLGGTTSVCGLLKKILQAIIQIGIPVAVVFIIWSGFKFVLAQGNEAKLTAAKKNFMFTLIGVAIFLGAWLLATVIAATVNAIGGSNIISCQ